MKTPATPSAIATVAVIGGGPAGLMAAEVLSRNGVQVDLYDAMPSVGRKFLLAGKGGMNLTHSESAEAFVTRYGDRQAQVGKWLGEFDPTALRAWVHELGVETFVGTSGRVFPVSMKAAPLLRAWLHRLRAGGVRFHVRHRWLGWEAGAAEGTGGLRFDTPLGETIVRADATVLALGGASWSRLGSDGAWVPLLEGGGIAVSPLRPSNSGFDVAKAWSEYFRERYVGRPVKPVVVAMTGADGQVHTRRGEFVVSEYGVEGGLVYALSAALRDEIATSGSATVHLDLAPDWSAQRLSAALVHPRGSRSISSHLQSRTGITGVRAGLLRELASKECFQDMNYLANIIKALPLTLSATRPIDEAISSAGGVKFDAFDENQMLKSIPGVFCAGEMLDWEAPTGGYLLSACFSSGHAAGSGVVLWLRRS